MAPYLLLSFPIARERRKGEMGEGEKEGEGERGGRRKREGGEER